MQAEGETATGEVQSGHFLRVSENVDTVFLFAAGILLHQLLGNNSQVSIFVVRFFPPQPFNQEKNVGKMAFRSSAAAVCKPPGSV